MRVITLDDVKYNRRRVPAGTELDVDDATGVVWCRAGLAEDMDGLVPTGERRHVTLAVNSSKHSGKATFRS